MEIFDERNCPLEESIPEAIDHIADSDTSEEYSDAMPDPALSRDELQIQSSFDMAIKTVRLNLSKSLVTAPTLRATGNQLKEMESLLLELKEAGKKRLAKLDSTDQTEIDAHQTHYIEHISAKEEDYFEQLIKYEQIMETAQSTAAANNVTTAKQAMFDAKKEQLVHDLDKILADVKSEDPQLPLSKSKQASYTQRVEEARLVMNKDLAETVNEMIHADPARAQLLASQLVTAQTECKSKIVNIVEAVASIKSSGLVTSTPNQTMLFPNEVSSASTATKTKTKYKYRPPEIPKFTGDIAKFPRFYEEWHESIMPEEEDSWILRVLDEKTPACDDLSIYTTSKEAWTYLSNKYANPLQVADTLIKDFMALTALEGHNDQQKLVDLETRLLKLKSQLNAVHEIEQISNNLHAICHAPDLSK